MRSAQRKTKAKVIQIRPVGYKVENALGARYGHCVAKIGGIWDGNREESE